MMLISFIQYDADKHKSFLWGQFLRHNGYGQAIPFARYLLRSCTSTGDFKVVITTSDGNCEYSLLEYMYKYETRK